MDVSRQKTAILFSEFRFFSFRMFVKQKMSRWIIYNLHNLMNLKFLEKFKNLPKTGKIAKVFFLRMRFHLMRQSELKVRANKQFLLVDNDAQRIGGRFLNHSTVVVQNEKIPIGFEQGMNTLTWISVFSHLNVRFLTWMSLTTCSHLNVLFHSLELQMV